MKNGPSDPSKVSRFELTVEDEHAKEFENTVKTDTSSSSEGVLAFDFEIWQCVSCLVIHASLLNDIKLKLYQSQSPALQFSSLLSHGKD